VMVYALVHVNPLPISTSPSSLVLVTIAVAVDSLKMLWPPMASPPVALIDEFRIVGDDEE